MGLVQALRRSIKGGQEKQHSISITPKAAVAIVPPKKVRGSVCCVSLISSPLLLLLPCARLCRGDKVA